MNKTTAILWLCVGGMAAGCAVPPRQTPPPTLRGAEGFALALEQDGRDVPVTHGEAHLAARPFTIVLSFPELRTARIMINASLHPALWEAVRLGRPAGSVLPLSKQALQEPLRNPHQRIFVTDRGYNYWYFLSDKIHRFDGVTGMEGRYTCRRMIACYAPDHQSPSRPISTLAGRTLYLTFVQQDLDPAGGRRVEKQAQPLKIVFR